MVTFVQRQSSTTKTKSEIMGTKMRINKRFLLDIISIGVGSAALTLATVNTVEIANLKIE